MQNCRCCLASYEKDPEKICGEWCELPIRDKEGKIVDPVGFCDFCDRDNERWYINDPEWHENHGNIT